MVAGRFPKSWLRYWLQLPYLTSSGDESLYPSMKGANMDVVYKEPMDLFIFSFQEIEPLPGVVNLSEIDPTVAIKRQYKDSLLFSSTQHTK